MGPHDLLCKWCSTFVGKDKKFCSIFCESRFTRSKRRKLAIKRPTHSGPPGQETEYESPRTSKTAFTKKEQFLDDVISAMKIVTDKPLDEDKHARQNGEPTAKESPDGDKMSSSKRTGIPRLDLNSAKREGKADTGSARKDDKDKPEMLKSKTRTIMKHRTESKIPVSVNSVSSARDSNRRTENKEKKEQSNLTQNSGVKRADKPNKPVNQKLIEGTLKKSNSMLNSNKETKEILSEFGVPAPISKTKSALDLEQRIRSSGYGAPVDPKLRPMSLKPKSASFILNSKRQSSASSVKSSKLSDLKTKKIESVPNLLREPSRPNAKGSGKWELIPKTIEEETSKTVKSFLDTSLEDEDPTPKTTQRHNVLDKSSVRSELRVLREESTASDLLDTSQIQDRLSSIKRKVEARRKGRDSRSSTGSDFDSSFLDSSIDLTTDRDMLNGPAIKSKTLSARLSARTNITRISKTFQLKREVK